MTISHIARAVALLGALASMTVARPAHAQERASADGRPTVFFHQRLVEAWRARSPQAYEAAALIDIVVGALPDVITVYPTEGYYYFQFHLNGDDVRGNIRFDVEAMDRGVIPFMFYKRVSDAQDVDPIYVERANDAALAIEKISVDEYRLRAGARTIQVKLFNGRAQEAAFVKRADAETYIGLVFDDSGEQFDLVFNTAAKKFYYLLNERAPGSETLTPLGAGLRGVLGARTGYAYLLDPFGRKMLVGVLRRNAHENNYFDGPFDQLPDRTMDMKVLYEAIQRADPAGARHLMSGTPFLRDNKDARYAILAYVAYDDVTQLRVFQRCQSLDALPAFVTCVRSRAIR